MNRYIIIMLCNIRKVMQGLIYFLLLHKRTIVSLSRANYVIFLESNKVSVDISWGFIWRLLERAASKAQFRLLAESSVLCVWV